MIFPEQLHAACERAATYRRQLAIEASHPSGNLQERIDIIPVFREEPVGDGWLYAGSVVDDVAGVSLAVWWHPKTDRVKVDRPPERTESPRPQPDIGPPIWWSMWAQRGHARDGFIYTLDGRDYSPQEGARLVTERRSDDGWAWRRP